MAIGLLFFLLSDYRISDKEKTIGSPHLVNCTTGTIVNSRGGQANFLKVHKFLSSFR
jgi:hypothetical protein